MPFTISHTAAVLPWVRKARLSPTALVAGSMSPDFEYFIRIGVKGIWGHDLPGIFLFDLPMTILFVIAFHQIVKNNLIDNMPVFLQKRFSRLKSLTLREDMFSRPLTFALCACGGALTHIFWDGFTHKSGYFVKRFSSFYDARIIHYEGVNYPLWYALQHLSTVVGLTILVIYVLRMKGESQHLAKPGLLYWLLLAGISTVVTWVRLQFPHQTGIPMTVIALISGSCIGLVVLGLLPQRREITSST
jgi:hypothetical protein